MLALPRSSTSSRERNFARNSVAPDTSVAPNLANVVCTPHCAHIFRPTLPVTYTTAFSSRKLITGIGEVEVRPFSWTYCGHHHYFPYSARSSGVRHYWICEEWIASSYLHKSRLLFHDPSFVSSCEYKADKTKCNTWWKLLRRSSSCVTCMGVCHGTGNVRFSHFVRKNASRVVFSRTVPCGCFCQW